MKIGFEQYRNSLNNCDSIFAKQAGAMYREHHYHLAATYDRGEAQ